MQSCNESLIVEWVIDIGEWPHAIENRDLLYEVMSIPEMGIAFERGVEGAHTQEFRVDTRQGSYLASVIPMGKPVTTVKIVGVPITHF